ncbi:MAG: hypothetical protein Q4D74_05320 [Comamonadaceae bacterium]|nr:hypothetical protein [Comamonadaceae bacterium]RRD58918.1 hypothetical protein EII20_00170 [Comamonadaceae bacterium OH2545_COT-014]
MRFFHSLSRQLVRGALALLTAQAALMAPTAALAQRNSPEAVKAVRQHRAEQGQALDAYSTSRRVQQRRHRHADAALRACLADAALAVVRREKCFRDHCQGRWGQGECPAGADFLPEGSSSPTPLGRCLRAAGRNPFKREGCGWRHCHRRWNAPECAAFKPQPPQSN